MFKGYWSLIWAIRYSYYEAKDQKEDIYNMNNNGFTISLISKARIIISCEEQKGYIM